MVALLCDTGSADTKNGLTSPQYGSCPISFPLTGAEGTRGSWQGDAGDLEQSSGSGVLPGWDGTVNSHKNRLDGVFDVAEGCPAQQLPQAPLSQLCWVLFFLLRCLEGRGRPAVETEPCG